MADSGRLRATRIPRYALINRERLEGFKHPSEAAMVFNFNPETTRNWKRPSAGRFSVLGHQGPHSSIRTGNLRNLGLVEEIGGIDRRVATSQLSYAGTVLIRG